MDLKQQDFDFTLRAEFSRELGLTLRKLSRDPFSMYSVTIMTGLPVVEGEREEGFHSGVTSVDVTQQKPKVWLRFILRMWSFGGVCQLAAGAR